MPHPIGPIDLQPTGTLVAEALPARVGARPAELRLTLSAELQCGRLGPGPVIVVLPAAERMPAEMRTGAVLVNGRAPSGLALSGHTVGITLPRTIGLTCNVIGPATVTVTFTRAAHLGNPMTPGTYRLWLRAGRNAATAPLIVS
jgi:hypothetical protein